MKTLANTITLALAVMGMAGAAISPAMASTTQTTTIKVSTGDLDLGTVRGQKTLEQRVEKAVRGVCRTASVETGSRMMSQDARACLAKARSNARQQVAVLMSDERRGG